MDKNRDLQPPPLRGFPSAAPPQRFPLGSPLSGLRLGGLPSDASPQGSPVGTAFAAISRRSLPPTRGSPLSPFLRGLPWTPPGARPRPLPRARQPRAVPARRR